MLVDAPEGVEIGGACCPVKESSQRAPAEASLSQSSFDSDENIPFGKEGGGYDGQLSWLPTHSPKRSLEHVLHV
jgi:hypothetical protein